MKSPLRIIIFSISIAFNIAFITVFVIAYRSWDSSPNAAKAADNVTHPWWEKDNIGLSETQKKSFRETDKVLMERITEIDKNMAIYRAQLLDVVSRENAAQEDIEGLLNEITGLQLKAQKIVVDSLITKRDMLNNQQKEEFFGCLHDQMRCNWQEHGRDAGKGRLLPREGCQCGWCN